MVFFLKKREKEEKRVFSLDLRPRLIKLPEFKSRKGVNVRYPLIPPFAYAHIHWDDKEKELTYFVEEPVLSNEEKEILKLIRTGLEEMINISFTKTRSFNILVNYLEKNVQSILKELGASVSEKTYQKIMYYIYRDAIGLNKIEPLMRDYRIEDIECNGVGFNIYIVHRKYENIKTNIVFSGHQELVDFVEKLAQKSERYISFSRPILDGTLPDGSRINATYTKDVTTRGPTFTIRKFTKEPWTPIHLMGFNTASAETFAYLWLAIQHKQNILVIGETASGKTVFMNSISHFVRSEARICSIEDTREINLAHDNWLPAVTRIGYGVSIAGKPFGEITLFDLLKETFRQNPDYVIVGEVRGEETYVLFQGMASGHPSFSTFHADSITSLIRRLETPPINLSPTLIEALDIICVVTHIKDSIRTFRRLTEVNEIIEVTPSAIGKVKSNVLFKWDPVKDKVKRKGDSFVLKKISKETAIPIKQLKKEVALRTKLLEKMKEKGIANYKEFTDVISAYYRDPKAVLKKYGIK